MKFKTFNSDKCREAVLGGITNLYQRLEKGFPTTALVVPPRVGKSNLMRTSAVEFTATGLVGGVVMLVPWLFLRKQLNDPAKIAKMLEDHGMNDAELHPQVSCDFLAGSIDPRFYLQQPKRTWWTMTMGQALQEHSRLILQSTATYMKEQDGRPLLAFIDEGHYTSSGPFGWGRIAADLNEAGAHLCLLTGTPYRSDELAPYGFERVEVDRKSWGGKTRTMIGEGKALEEIKTGDRAEYEVRADYEYSLREAWSTGIIAQIQAHFFNCKADQKDISAYSKSSVSRALAKALRDPEVITEAVHLMLEELALRRKSEAGRDTACIVFVGNDDEDDDERDFECRQVKRIIDANWKTYFPGTTADVKIATLGDDNGKKAQETIARFVGDDYQIGIGNVIIVKQMGGVGLDAPRLKIGVDLSTTRTLSSTIQRWLRIATKYGGVEFGMLILPKDPITLERYEQIVKENGGQYCIENVQVIDSQIIDVSEPEELPDIEITDARRDGSVDMSLVMIDADEDRKVDLFFAQNPLLALRLSRREASIFIKAGAFNVPTQVAVETPTTTEFVDIEGEVSEHHNTMNRLCTELANREAGHYYKGNTAWIATRKKYMAWAKAHAGFAQDDEVLELSSCRDLVKLNTAIVYLRQKLA